MRFLLLSLFIISNLFALNDVSKPYNFAPRDTLKSSKFNANYDTLYSRTNQNNDSIDNSFIRFYDLEKHDSTLKYVAVDTIRSNPDIDSIKGDVVITGSPTITGTVYSTQDLIATDSVKASTVVSTGNMYVGIGTTGSTPTPNFINLGKTCSDGSVASKCKMFVYDDGANELYGMSIGPQSDLQYHAHSSVSTSTHRFYVNDVEKFRVDNSGSTSKGKIMADSITTNGTDYMIYNDTTFYDSLYDGGSYKSRVLCRIVQVGNKITLYHPAITASSFSTGPILRGLPSKFLPSNIYVPCLVYMNSSTSEMGVLEFNNASLGTPYTFILKETSLSSTGSGQYGIRNSVFTWIIN